MTSGWNWTPYQPRWRSSKAATGAPRRRCGGDDPIGSLDYRVEVTHPHGLLAGKPRQQRATGSGDRKRGTAVLATIGMVHDPAVLLGDELGAVADPENGDSELVHVGVDGRRALDVHRLGATAEDDSSRLAGGDLGGADRVSHDLAVHPGLPYPTGDQLRVLGSEVDDEDRVDRTIGARYGSRRCAGHGCSGRGGRLADADRPNPGPHCREVTTSSADWKSLTLVYPHVAIDARSPPTRLVVPSAVRAGPTRISSSVPRVGRSITRLRGRVA